MIIAVVNVYYPIVTSSVSAACRLKRRKTRTRRLIVW